MINQLLFDKFTLKYEHKKWVDYNVDDESPFPIAISKNCCWLVPQYERDDYIRRNTCILIKEFSPNVDVVAREKHNEQVMNEVCIKLETNVYALSNDDYLGFDNNLNNIVHSHYHKKTMDNGVNQYRVKYIVQKESYSLLIVIKFFESTSPETFTNINHVLISIT